MTTLERVLCAFAAASMVVNVGVLLTGYRKWWQEELGRRRELQVRLEASARLVEVLASALQSACRDLNALGAETQASWDLLVRVLRKEPPQ